MNKSTTNRAYQYIRDGILSGALPLGSPISEMEISGAISVSRSPVREALRQLEAEGLVIIYPGRGAFVIQISSQDIQEIFEMRTLLEVAALRKAYRHIPDEQLDRFERSITQLEPSTHQPNEFFLSDRSFHELIVNNCGNSRLKKMYAQLYLQIALIRPISGMSPQHFSKSRSFHLQLIRSIREGTLQEAEQILTEHLSDVQTNTLNVYAYR